MTGLILRVRSSVVWAELGIEPLFLCIERNYWVGSRIWLGCLHLEIFQVHPTGKRPLEQTQNYLKGLYNPLDWERLGNPQEELERDVWIFLLELLVDLISVVGDGILESSLYCFEQFSCCYEVFFPGQWTKDKWKKVCLSLCVCIKEYQHMGNSECERRVRLCHSVVCSLAFICCLFPVLNTPSHTHTPPTLCLYFIPLQRLGCSS